MKWPYSFLTRFVSFLFFILAISSPAKADFIHIVKKGESLYRIAKKYNLSAKQLQEANELSNTRIKAGQRLTIPGTQTGDPAVEKKKWKKPGSSEDELPELGIPETHTVKKGETLAKIAFRYHLWVEDLEEINQLQGKKVRPGQIIYLQGINEVEEERGAGKFGKPAKKKEEEAESLQVRIK